MEEGRDEKTFVPPPSTCSNAELGPTPGKINHLRRRERGEGEKERIEAEESLVSVH